jgi:hypothetical protein
MVVNPPAEPRLSSRGGEVHGREKFVVHFLQLIAGKEVERAGALLQCGGMTVEVRGQQSNAHNHSQRREKHLGKLSRVARFRLVNTDVSSIHHAAKLCATGGSVNNFQEARAV